MERIVDLISEVEAGVKTLQESYQNTNKKYQEKQESNSLRVVTLNEDVTAFNDELIKLDEEFNTVSENYKAVENHITEIKGLSGGYELLDASELENMAKDASVKKEEIISRLNNKKTQINDKINFTNQQLIEINAENEAIEAILPRIKEDYERVVNTTLEDLVKINENINSLKTELVVEEVEVEVSNVQNPEELVKDEAEETELTSEKEEEPEVLEEPTEEVAPLVVEAPVAEEKPMEFPEEKEVLGEPVAESLAEPVIDEEPEVLATESYRETENPSEEVRVVEKLVEADPTVDYSMNQYVGIDDMNLSEGQKNNLMRNMSSEKFIQIKTVLAEYNVPLSDVTAYYDQFVKLEDVKALEETLSTFKGIGKNNDNKDFSSMLDVIFDNDNNVLQDNLLTVYSKGENPKSISIQKLSSRHYPKLDDEAEALNVDVKHIEKVHPVATMIMPLDKVVEFDSKTNEKVLEKVV